MGIYHRRYYVAPEEPGEALGERVECYRQPLFLRLRFLAFNLVYKLCYLAPVHYFIEHGVDNVAYFLHRRRCNNDCVRGKTRKSATEPWEETVLCGYLSACARLDLKHYDLDHAGNHLIKDGLPLQ